MKRTITEETFCISYHTTTSHDPIPHYKHCYVWAVDEKVARKKFLSLQKNKTGKIHGSNFVLVNVYKDEPPENEIIL